jgi:hypothetical protein
MEGSNAAMEIDVTFSMELSRLVLVVDTTRVLRMILDTF